MGTLIREFALFAGILGVITLPLVFVAPPRGRAQTLRRFLAAATVIAVVAALVGLNSEQLVEQCRAAGDPSCYDPGGRGVQLVAVGIYSLFAWSTAFFIFRD